MLASDMVVSFRSERQGSAHWMCKGRGRRRGRWGIMRGKNKRGGGRDQHTVRNFNLQADGLCCCSYAVIEAKINFWLPVKVHLYPCTVSTIRNQQQQGRRRRRQGRRRGRQGRKRGRQGRRRGRQGRRRGRQGERRGRQERETGREEQERWWKRLAFRLMVMLLYAVIEAKVKQFWLPVKVHLCPYSVSVFRNQQQWDHAEITAWFQSLVCFRVLCRNPWHDPTLWDSHIYHRCENPTV